jgi:hypothetical protein
MIVRFFLWQSRYNGSTAERIAVLQEKAASG